jgi:hypothetical protein
MFINFAKKTSPFRARMNLPPPTGGYIALLPNIA